MKKELEKKFDEEFVEKGVSPTSDGHDMTDDEWNGHFETEELRINEIKSFISEHFIARSDVQKDLEKMNLYPKADLLDMVGEDFDRHGVHCRLIKDGFCNCGVNSYNQAKAEIRERINGRIQGHNSDSKDIQTKEKD